MHSQQTRSGSDLACRQSATRNAIISLAAFLMYATYGCDNGSHSGGGSATAAPTAPGMWGTTDTTSQLDFIGSDAPFQYQDHSIFWAGAQDVRAQWFKILASYVDPQNDFTWNPAEHAKGEPPGNTYYLWHYDRPMPEGTKILVEGDFPHARYFNIGFASPTDIVSYPPPSGWRAVNGDGKGLQEIIFADQDIVPDPGSTNPFLPGSDRDAVGRHYHVTFELRNGDPTSLNVFEGRNAAVMPNRAPGNLRYGGTFKHNANSEKIDPATGQPYGFRGPYMWVRIHLPDRFDPWGGVAPPVIRIQFPGQEPVLAPISREMELNEGGLLDPYAIEDNPAVAGDPWGRSVNEIKANDELSRRAVDTLDSAGPVPAKPSAYIQTAFSTNGQLDFFKNFNVGYYLKFLNVYAEWRLGTYSDAQMAAYMTSVLPAAFLADFGMGPSLPEPLSTQSSGHNVNTSYLGSTAAPSADDLLVISGKLPRVPRTLAGSGVGSAGDELRYVNLVLLAGGSSGESSGLGLTAIGDVQDESMVLDQNGRYFVVIGRPGDRPAAATAHNGVTWRSLPLGSRYSVFWRFTATDETPWTHSLHRVRWSDADYALGTPAGTGAAHRQAIKDTMGEYYPVARYQSRAQVETMLASGTTGLSLPPSYVPDLIGPPGGRGTLQVSIAPGGVSPAWRIDYGPWRSGGATFQASVGRHLLSFRSVSGYVTPHPRYVDVPATGAQVTGTYVPSTGSWVSGPCSGGFCYPDGGLENVLADGVGGLYAIGGFSTIDGVAAAGIAHWTGGAWNPMGTGLAGAAEAMAIYAGDLIAGGYFNAPAPKVARWNGSAWTGLGSGMNDPVRALATLPGAVVGSGFPAEVLVAGGMFTSAGGVAASHIAVWNGTTWAPLGSGIDGNVYALASFGGKLIAAGNFDHAGGVAAANIAAWDGSAWSPLDAGVDAQIYGLAVYGGQLYATGDFERAGSGEALHIASWDGAGWSSVGGGLDGLGRAYGRALAVWNGKLVVGGNFTVAGTGVSARRIAAWDGVSWSALGNGFTSWVEGLAVLGAELIACGWFNNSSEGGGPISIGRFTVP